MEAVLTDSQMETLARIQNALSNMEKLRQGINAAAKSDGLELSLGSLPSLGMMMHKIDGLLFDNNGAVVREMDRINERKAA